MRLVCLTMAVVRCRSSLPHCPSTCNREYLLEGHGGLRRAAPKRRLVPASLGDGSLLAGCGRPTPEHRYAAQQAVRQDTGACRLIWRHWHRAASMHWRDSRIPGLGSLLSLRPMAPRAGGYGCHSGAALSLIARCVVCWGHAQEPGGSAQQHGSLSEPGRPMCTHRGRSSLTCKLGCHSLRHRTLTGQQEPCAGGTETAAPGGA